MSKTFLRRLFMLALCACLVLLAVLPAGADFGDYSGVETQRCDFCVHDFATGIHYGETCRYSCPFSWILNLK